MEGGKEGEGRKESGKEERREGVLMRVLHHLLIWYKNFQAPNAWISNEGPNRNQTKICVMTKFQDNKILSSPNLLP